MLCKLCLQWTSGIVRLHIVAYSPFAIINELEIIVDCFLTITGETGESNCTSCGRTDKATDFGF